jgi:predicted MFS family arabinose efflux permease
MAGLHALAGVAAGCALTFTHGTIGRSERPHRLFAIVGIALGVFAVVFLGATPKLVAAAGGPMLFWVFGGVMLVAAVVCALAFPHVVTSGKATATVPAGSIDAAVWFGIFGISCMTLVQAMTFSFLERMGADRGFGLDAVTAVLIALGIVNLFPSALAAALERRWPARNVVLAGPAVQAALALVITQSSTFAPYAAAAMFFTAVTIFTHTFAFGLLAQLDRSCRAVAATPAMLMVGSAIGPILGGTLVKLHGYGSLGMAAVAVAALSIFCFTRTRRAGVLTAA